ncbi:MAG: hypothetical protein ACFFE8_15435 [Candidatus Heimdallarchaeota archaeon]
MRKKSEILAILELTIDSCFEVAKSWGTISPEEKAIIDKLGEWKLKLEPQVMQTLEAPMDDKDFYDVMHQLLRPVIDSVIEQAKANGVITAHEQRLIDTIVEKLDIE